MKTCTSPIESKTKIVRRGTTKFKRHVICGRPAKYKRLTVEGNYEYYCKRHALKYLNSPKLTPL